MTKSLTALLAATTAFAAFTMPATAQCVQDDATHSTCAADDADGYALATDYHELTVEPGVTVSSSGHTIVLEDGAGGGESIFNTVINDGSITSDGGDAIKGGEHFTVTNRPDGIIATSGPAGDDGITAGDYLLVNNQGTISVLDKAIDGGDRSELNNDGSIVSYALDADTVDLGDHARVVNGHDGVIAGTDRAVDLGDFARLHNDGFIGGGGGEGIEMGDRGELTNYGTIESYMDDAFNAGQRVEVYNWGTIANRGFAGAEPQDGIDLDSGQIYNYGTGTISSAEDAAIDFDAGNGSQSGIYNEGVIEGAYAVMVETGASGDPANVDRQRIINKGVLRGTSGIAALLGAGMDEVNLYEGSTLEGSIDFGADDDLLAFIGAPAIEGRVGIFDGGDDTDVISMADITMANVLSVTGAADDFVLSLLADLGDPLSEYAYNFVNFELIEIGDETYTTADFVAGVGAIPLPAGLPLLAGALGGLALLRRRHAA